MAKKKNSKKDTPPKITSGIVPSGWNLGTDFETIQVMPASGAWATYENGSRYPVVAWAMQARLLRKDEQAEMFYDDDEVPPGFVSRVVGLIMSEKDAALVEADSPLITGHGDEFAGYLSDL